ncbi:uncharacterized protein LOC121380411 [Gigantopelta aegis]|uniref:uncharacterized protein LOC121380411 n=1 Tax=Gigantopelta aegis TaxID=1735272 RepID=UPI001B889B93|nr:uncharacterized protein LOC121380411 [Gigantopelta aegis]
MATLSLYIVSICFPVVLLTARFTQSAITKCEKISSCSCKTNNGKVIDLSPLAGVGTPRFKDKMSPSGDLFSWNPCFAFSEGGLSGLAACQQRPALPPLFYNTGSQDSAVFEVDASKGLQVVYTATTDVLRTTKVTLKCDHNKEQEFTAQGEVTPGVAVYDLTLVSKYCCEDEREITVTVTLSIGSILIIVFFSALLMYLLTGSVVQKYGRKAAGREIIPNYVFWSSVPGYIKSGFIFTGSCIKRTKTYDNI